MITDRIKALFQFIEFLHSNIENFKQFDNVLNEVNLLVYERNRLRPRENFADKLRFDEIQTVIKPKSDVINENIFQVIKAKVTELTICDWDKPETLQNWNFSEIYNLKDNFSKDDIPEILLHKSKYLELRTEINSIYFQFSDLDEMLKVLFDFFKEPTENENEITQLYNEIKDCLPDCSLDQFIYILENKKLPDGREKPFLWDGFGADGIRFRIIYGFTLKELKSCFNPKKGKFIDKNVHKLKASKYKKLN